MQKIKNCVSVGTAHTQVFRKLNKKIYRYKKTSKLIEI